MEENRPGIGPEDQATSEFRRKRRFGELLDRLFRRPEQEAAERRDDDEEEDDEEDVFGIRKRSKEKSGKQERSGRLQRLFSRLSGGLLFPQVEQVKEPEKNPAPGQTPEASAVASEYEMPANPGNVLPEPVTYPEHTTAAETDVDRPDEAATAAATPDEGLPRPTGERSRTSEVPPDEAILPPVEEIARRDNEASGERWTGSDSDGGVVYERPRGTGYAAAPRPERIEKERVIERRGGGAFLAFAGAELLSRGRDRKLRKADAETRRELEDVKAKLESEKKMAHDLQERSRQERERLASKRAGEEVQENRTQNPFFAAETARPTRQNAEAPVEAATVRKIAAEPRPLRREEAMAPSKEILPPVPDAVERRAEPATVLKEVEQAAEKNLPLEHYYELRHEVKDATEGNAAAAGAGASMAPLSSVMRRRIAQDAVLARAAASTAPASKDEPGFFDNAAYRQAMKNGFWGAVGLLVLFGILYLLQS